MRDEETKKLLQEALKRLGFVLDEISDPDLEAILWQAYRRVNEAEENIDLIVEEVTQMYIRNSAFPGDMVGWLDDDFDDPSEDDEQ